MSWLRLNSLESPASSAKRKERVAEDDRVTEKVLESLRSSAKRKDRMAEDDQVVERVLESPAVEREAQRPMAEDQDSTPLGRAPKARWPSG